MTAALRPAGGTRERIEQAALALFAERGVNGVSVRDIAAKVGVTEGALYRHFASKDDLARALFVDRYGAIAQGIDAVRAQGGTFEARVRALVALLAGSFDQDPAGFSYVLVAQHDHLRTLAPDAPGNAVAALSRLFEDAMAAGDIPRGDVALVTAMALGLMVQPAIFRIYDRLERAPSAYLDDIAAAILRVASAPKPDGTRVS